MKRIIIIIICQFVIISCTHNQQNNANTSNQSNQKIIDFCDYEIIKRDDGIIVTQYPPIPISSDDKLQFGISISSNGYEYYLSALVRFFEIASKITSDLTIRLESNEMLTFKLVNSGLSYIEKSEAAIGIFLIKENQIESLKNSSILTVSFMLEDNLMHTLECKVNSSVLSKQLNCVVNLSSKNFNKADSEKYKYSIFYPSEFELVKPSGQHTDLKFQNTKTGSSIVVAVYPRTKEEYSISAHDYTKEVMEQLFQQQNLSHIIVKSEKNFIDNHKAFMIYYTSPTYNTKAIEVYFYKENFAYVITAMTKENNFNDFEEVFKKSIYSLKFN